MPEFAIDHGSTVPPYEQLRVQILESASSGALAAGAKLPTVRGLADRLGLAAGTVARAYRELESLGIIETRGRNGTFVSAQGDPASREAQNAAREYAERVHRLGVSRADALDWVTAALRGEPSDS